MLPQVVILGGRPSGVTVLPGAARPIGLHKRCQPLGAAINKLRAASHSPPATRLTGRTPTTLPAGTHDVEVVQDGQSAILIGAFTVEGGKLCATRSGSGSAVAAGLALVLGLLSRRRSARS